MTNGHAVAMKENILYTVGHSSRSAGILCDLLSTAHVTTVADVRTVPRSSRFPWFDQGSLGKMLEEEGVDYVWVGRQLGGRRPSVPDSPHVALKPDMRGYADHMATEAFRRTIHGLCVMARERRLAILCAERRPENCHRSFLSDYFVHAEGFRVTHLIDVCIAEEHRVSPHLRWNAGIPVYDRWATGSLFS